MPNHFTQYIDCKQCGHAMEGIRDVAARHTCYECGGASLIEDNEERLRIRERMKAGRVRPKVGRRL